MNDIKCPQKKMELPHGLTLEERKNLIISGVTEVDSFDDKFITTYTHLGELTVKGENLNIKKLNLDTGDMEIEGTVYSLSYQDKQSQKSESFFSKLFK